MARKMAAAMAWRSVLPAMAAAARKRGRRKAMYQRRIIENGVMWLSASGGWRKISGSGGEISKMWQYNGMAAAIMA